MPRHGTIQPPKISPWLRFLFYGIARRRVRRAFRALRVANADRIPAGDTPHLVVYLNHPSWWDPLVGFVLSRHLFGSRKFYAPMDAVALNRYRIFRRLGMFPVAMDSLRGAAEFLRISAAVLDMGHILAVTPQGHFTDARVRPVVLRPGLAGLLHRRAAQERATTVLPLALEYAFWDQRQPEALVNCGEPIRFSGVSDGVAEGSAPTQEAIQALLVEAMTRTQDELAALSLRRDPLSFFPLLEGRRGSAGFYGLVERLRAFVGGNPERGDHRAASVAQNADMDGRNR